MYLFILFSRIEESFTYSTGLSLHVGLILSWCGALAALATGKFLRAAGSRMAFLLFALTGWLMLATLFSTWKAGSVMLLRNYWISALLTSLLVISLTESMEQLRKLLYTLAFSLVPILFACSLASESVLDRLQVSFGNLSNPNDLAFVILLLVPFAGLVFNNEPWGWKRVAAAIILVWSLAIVFRTGSRGGLLVLLFLAVALFVAGSAATRVKMIVGSVLVVGLAAALLPSMSDRLMLLFSEKNVNSLTDEERVALDSSAARKQLFWDSLTLSLHNPAFGVGPGVFMAAMADKQKAQGLQQVWRETHNTYTQLSSEAGFPALTLFLSALIYCMASMWRLRRQTRGQPRFVLIRRSASALLLSLPCFAIGACFGSYAYNFYFTALAGLSQACYLAAQREMATAPVVVSASTPGRVVARAPLATPASSTGQLRKLESTQNVWNRRIPQRPS